MAVKENADLSRITVTPGQRSGQPSIRGLRVTVWDVLDMLASGMTEDEILDDYPYLERPTFQPSMPTLRRRAGSGSRVETSVRCESLTEAGRPARRAFSGSVHVFDTGLAKFTTDEAIWEYARINALVIVTADSDFLGLAKERGAPPKVVRLRTAITGPLGSRPFSGGTPFGSRNWIVPRG